jgi:hypothetical protein
MVERGGFELATPRSVVLGKLSATLAQYLGREKGSSGGENLVAGNSPLISEPFAHSAPVLGTRTIWPLGADF